MKPGEGEPAADASATFEARLSAWHDGQLDDRDGAATMDQLVMSDEALGARVQRLRHIDDLVRAAVPEEPVPAELLARLGLAPAAAPADSARVINLAAVRSERAAVGALGRPSALRSGLWRIAAQVLLVVGAGLGVTLALVPGGPGGKDSAPYRTLSDQARVRPSGAETVNGVVMFAPGTDAATARALAARAGITLVGTPNTTGVWKAAIEPGRRDAVLAALRQDRRVTLAEPIDGVSP